MPELLLLCREFQYVPGILGKNLESLHCFGCQTTISLAAWAVFSVFMIGFLFRVTWDVGRPLLQLLASLK